MPDQVYSEANPAAHGGPRRPEPFVELGLMSKQPPVVVSHRLCLRTCTD